jgi:hypothetical protein
VIPWNLSNCLPFSATQHPRRIESSKSDKFYALL